MRDDTPKACPDCSWAVEDHPKGGKYCVRCHKRWFEHAGLLIDSDTVRRISSDGP